VEDNDNTNKSTLNNQLHGRLGQRQWWVTWQHVDSDPDGNGCGGAELVAEQQRSAHSCVVGMIIIN
jgi:hypothetical protein